VRTFIGQSLSRRRRGHRQIASLLVGAALLIAGCSIVTTPSTQTASALKPIDQAALQSLVDTTIKELLIPGAVVLLRTPHGDFTAASGTTELGTRNRPGADTHFRIASNTKTMTAAVILQLAQEGKGKLSLSDPVSKYVPGVPNGDNITIAQLLEMRSGLYNYTNDPIISATIDTDPSQGLDPRRVTGNCIRAPTQFPAG
jgi:CubicO group peptidase (beta-lactamase class C family)